MTLKFEVQPAAAQGAIIPEPFDRWITADGDVAAQFHRCGPAQFLVRFPEQADFAIDLGAQTITATPVPELSSEALNTLYRNSILPIIGNHAGGLNLHGSAVATDHGAIAFIGLSRRGKTTLAGAFAAAGHPFLTEDCVALENTGAAYMVQPMRPVLRVFHDSASFLLGGRPGWQDEDAKREVDASIMLPFADAPAPLRHIFILGPGEAESVTIATLGEGEAMAQLMQQAFVLDVEDKPRLRAHFGRVADLAGTTACHLLDYPRRYDQLPQVIAAVAALCARSSD